MTKHSAIRSNTVTITIARAGTDSKLVTRNSNSQCRDTHTVRVPSVLCRSQYHQRQFVMRHQLQSAMSQKCKTYMEARLFPGWLTEVDLQSSADLLDAHFFVKTLQRFPSGKVRDKLYVNCLRLIRHFCRECPRCHTRCGTTHGTAIITIKTTIDRHIHSWR
jgi:hypothetical protein